MPPEIQLLLYIVQVFPLNTRKRKEDLRNRLPSFNKHFQELLIETQTNGTFKTISTSGQASPPHLMEHHLQKSSVYSINPQLDQQLTNKP